jgi:hypothetical protein
MIKIKLYKVTPNEKAHIEKKDRFEEKTTMTTCITFIKTGN